MDAAAIGGSHKPMRMIWVDPGSHCMELQKETNALFRTWMRNVLVEVDVHRPVHSHRHAGDPGHDIWCGSHACLPRIVNSDN